MASTTPQDVAKQTVTNWVSSFDKAITTKDVSLVSEYQTPDCIRSRGPQSLLEQHGMPIDVSVSEYEGFIAPTLPLTESLKTVTHSILVDGDRHHASVHVSYHVKIKGSPEFVIENLSTMVLTDDNTKVKKVLLWADTKGTLDYIGALQKAFGAGTA